MSLAIVDAELDGERVTLRADDGVISAVGPDVRAEPGDETVDAAGMTLVGGLINGHTHAAMTLFRSFGDDLPLMEWLQTKIWPAEGRLDADDVYWGTRLACIEMVRSGTVKFFDMYWQPRAVAQAVVDTGMRAVLTPPIFDGLDASTSGPVRKDALETLDALAVYAPLVEPSIGPHAIYTVSPETLEWAVGVATDRDIPLHIHLAETEGEVQQCLATHDMTAGHYVERLGLLGPRTILAHGNYFTDDEYGLIGERGATIVTNPVSNLKLANGRIFPFAKAAAAGVALGLGTDGASSNNNLDLFEEMKFFALLQKHEAVDASIAPAHEVLELAQGRRSPLLGGRPIAVGEPADVLLVRSDVVEMTPGDLDADLVYAASGHVVDTTIVAGKVVMRGRHIEGEEEVRAEVRARVPRLTAPA